MSQRCEGCGARTEHLQHTADDVALCASCYEGLVLDEAFLALMQGRPDTGEPDGEPDRPRGVVLKFPGTRL